MMITVNDEPFEIPSGSSLSDLALLKQLPDKGVAVAVNNNMVTRAEWQNRILAPGDDVVIIRAVCGG